MRGAAGAAAQGAPFPAGRRQRRRAHVTLLRQIPADTPVHRLWAGTKLLAVAALSVTLSFAPSWAALAIVALLLAVTAMAARIPVGAWPRLPAWFWAMVLLGAVLTLTSGGAPHVGVGGARVGLGGVDAYVRFVAVGAELLVAGAMVGWTTPLGDIAPALQRLLRPLRALRLPVDEWAVTVALCVRSLPLLVQETRILIAARRLRPAPPRPGRVTWRRWYDEPVDLLTTALVSAIRRAGELAEAISARGGTGVVSAKVAGPAARDAVAAVVVAAACAGAVLL